MSSQMIPQINPLQKKGSSQLYRGTESRRECEETCLRRLTSNAIVGGNTQEPVEPGYITTLTATVEQYLRHHQAGSFCLISFDGI